MSDPRFTIYQDEAGAWRWRLQAANNRVLASGESHTRKQDAERAVRTVKETVWAVVMLEDLVSPE